MYAQRMSNGSHSPILSLQSSLTHMRCMQTIFPPLQKFVEEFHAGKAAGASDDAQPAKTVVKDHATSKPAAPAATPATAPSKASDKTKRGTRTLEIKETFYACTLSLCLFIVCTVTFSHS